MKTLAQLVSIAYAVRACFACGVFGFCRHREFDVEAALIAVELKHQEEPRKPPQSATTGTDNSVSPDGPYRTEQAKLKA